MVELSTAEKIAVAILPVIFAITVHEVAHGWVASKLGDQTARMMGRITLNPIRHIDPVGTVAVPLMMILLTPFAFGWAKPVPVDWRNLRHPRRDMALVAIAGPGANFVMLALWTWLLALLAGATVGNDHATALLFEMAKIGIIINTVLIALNILPLPPLDGSRVVSAFLPAAAARKYNALERWGLLILLGLIFTGVLERILRPMMGAVFAVVQTFLPG